MRSAKSGRSRLEWAGNRGTTLIDARRRFSPVWFPVPPDRYGGIEAVVQLLADGLVDAGIDVTLFASGDSSTKATLVSAFETAPSETSAKAIGSSSTFCPSWSAETNSTSCTTTPGWSA